MSINILVIQGTVDHVTDAGHRLEILLRYEDPDLRRWGISLVEAPLRWRGAIEEGDAVLFSGSLEFEGSNDSIRAESFLPLATDPPQTAGASLPLIRPPRSSNGGMRFTQLGWRLE